MPAPTHGGYDWMPTQPVNVEVLPAVVEVEVTTLPPVIEVNVASLPPVIEVEVTVMPPIGAVDVASMPASTTVDMASSDEARDIAASQINGVVGSMLTCDRKGKIYMAEGFESGMGCWAFSTSAGGTGWVTRATRRDGLQAYAVQLASYAGDYTLQRRFCYPAATKIGMEISFAIPNKNFTIQLNPFIYKGGVSYHPGLWIEFFNNKVAYKNGIATYQDFYTIPSVSVGYSYWYTVKFVYDLAALKYVKMIFNGKEVDMSAYNIPSDVQLGVHHACGIIIGGTIGFPANGIIYIDNIMLTEEV